jgi:ER lumen protein retaining receptor
MASHARFTDSDSTYDIRQKKQVNSIPYLHHGVVQPDDCLSSHRGKYHSFAEHVDCFGETNRLEKCTRYDIVDNKRVPHGSAAMASHRRRLLLLLLLASIGISLRTHELFLLVFVARFADLFSNFYYSIFYSVIKILYLVLTAAIVLSMRCQESVQSTYNKVYDSFPHWRYAVLPCILITMTMNKMEELLYSRNQAFSGMRWTFSLFLEAMAMVPQLVLLQKVGGCDCVTGWYIFGKGAYGALYLLHVTLRSPPEVPFRYQGVLDAAVVVRTMVYVIFFGCVFQNNASLRHKKDDSQRSRTLLSELEEPLVALELQPPQTP